MGGERAHRLLVVALSICLAGFLAVAAKVAPSPDRTHLQVGMGTTRFAEPPRGPAFVPPPAVAAPAPRAERPIQAPDGAPTTPTDAPTPPTPVDSAFRDRAPIVRAPTTDAAKTVYGVIIGINDYPGTSSDLHGAVPDAEDMSDALAMYGVPEANVHTLLDGDATTAAINNAFAWLDSTTTPLSTVVIFYAGHVRKLDDRTEAIVAADGGVLPDWYLARQLDPLPASKVWIVMAACYGGGFDELMKPGRILTAAADANSLAYENESFDRSYLDEYLIHQALLEGRSSGPTAQQAFDYAQAGLQRDYPDRTLTQIDMSTSAISLDGVSRDRPPESPPPDPGSGGGQVPAPAPPDPSSPPAAPPPCQNLLGLLCPPGSR
jgi:hypothetical protein